MALTAKSSRSWWSRLHFLLRFAGLTGLLCSGIGAALAFLAGILSVKVLSDENFVRTTLLGQRGDLDSRVALGFLLGGGALALLAVLVEALVILRTAAGRRSAFGLNATVQVALAAILLVGINYLSSLYHVRADWTRARQFTLAPEIQSQLRQLKEPTTIVVYQRHKTFGQLADKPDAYDYAAERKVVEKVKDLVEQFREFGPQFRVVVLDVEEDGYNEKLASLTKNARELREAIDAAPDNSIFFAAGNKVQRLSFNDFYELDKTASRQADGGRGNLVLLYQGVEPFARRVLNIDEKRPKIAVAVVHEWLTTEGPEEFGFGGLKKALTARGFDVRDVILKKWSEFAPMPEPAVYTYDESRFDRLEEQLTELDADIKNFEEELRDLTALQKLWTNSSLDDLTKKYAKQLGGRKVDEALRRRQLAFFEQNAMILRAVLSQYREDRKETNNEKASLNVDTAAEERRMTDLKAKLERSLADCDLLFIPRMTIRNVNIGDRIPNQLYRLDEGQVAAVKNFLKAGKPVLACFGPLNEHPSDRMRLTQFGPSGPDELEDALGNLGIKFGKQTVLFNVESKSFAERRTGLLVSGAGVEVPPVDFEGKTAAPRPLGKPDDSSPKKDNPIRASMRIAAHSLGKNLDLRVRYPRPIYYESPDKKVPEFEPEFVVTSGASWNEDQPFPTAQRTPRFEPPKPDDPNAGTPDEKRRGPFPIGVAVETNVPADWYADAKNTKPARVRVAAIGNGSLFTGTTLTPAKEELLLDTCNWLLGRDDLLPRADRVWDYPRVSLTSREYTLWRWGAWLGLPGLFTYMGLVVLMVRRLR
jgi:hypothetical protein